MGEPCPIRFSGTMTRNQTFLFDEDAANLMNYYEFVSDTWFSFYFTHHFDGPSVQSYSPPQKLKWREVVHMRLCLWYHSGQKRELLPFPRSDAALRKRTILGAGAGIENIFKIFRVDAVWRLTHLHDLQNPNVTKFGLFVSMNFTF